MEMGIEFTEHARGRLEHRLQGVQRGRAHIALLERFVSMDFEGVASIAKQDPSLLVEPIPTRHPIVPGNHDEMWKREASTYTRWLHKAVGWDSPAFVDAVKAVVEAGVHPDDKAAFVGDVLLGAPRWRNDPNLLSFALKHGASSTLPPQREGDGGRSLIRPVLAELGSNLVRASLDDHKVYVSGLIRSANLLLDAGASLIDHEGGQQFPPKHPFEPGISLLAGAWYEHSTPWVLKPLRALVQRLHEHGAKLDLLCGYENVPLVVYAIRNRNLPLTLQLVEMGAKVDDSSICREQGPACRKVRGIVDEAQIAFGLEGRAKVLEAMMRKQLSASSSASASNDSHLLVRRRARAI
jgi:hypothetical protein